MTKFSEMSSLQLVAAYNEMIRSVDSIFVQPVDQFESFESGVRRCEGLARSIQMYAKSDIPNCIRRYQDSDEPHRSSLAAQNREDLTNYQGSSISVEADRLWRNWQPTPGCMTRPRKATFERQLREQRKAETIEALASAEKPQLSNASRHRRADKVIRILVSANPRRPGTDAHAFFEAMRGGPTVGEYLTKFKDQRKAAQGLWNTCRDNFAKLLG
jgi:hypothetical protein